MTLNETCVKDAVKELLSTSIDTLVTRNDLAIRKSRMWFINRICYLTCPDFDDFYVSVKIDSTGGPKKILVHFTD